ncbi:class 2 aldolase/adducin domain -containing protein [Coccidioides immitis RMSCC 3703]|uniref:Class 2 aldolase/adducin domain-containing protein n=1 Tax=Coccidioides immitis RMSCC 3703 TaxID=454286 RepID=A0A0J8TEM5_COCIT|nr:class 2 aldolase/adducin domain -containing protein [Coccidioides immitis RMSCC 3703]
MSSTATATETQTATKPASAARDNLTITSGKPRQPSKINIKSGSISKEDWPPHSGSSARTVTTKEWPGHITIRDPVDTTTFWVNPFGVAFSLIKASDLIHVDHEGNVIGGGEVRLLNTAAYAIHSAIHTARPDVMCAAHSHSIYGRSFCALGKPLDIITQDSCAFYNDLAVYKQFNGIVLAAEEGKNIASALGNKKAALLQNHGLLTVGKTIEEAVFWFVSLEKGFLCSRPWELWESMGSV